MSSVVSFVCPSTIPLSIGGAVPVIATHSTEVPGAKSYAHQLDDELEQIKYVRLLNVRNSHIRPGRRQPKVRVAKYTVIVHFYADGSMQRLMVVPARGVKLETLRQAVSVWVAANPPQ